MALVKRTIRGAAAGPHLLIVAGVHGDEFEPVGAVRRLAAQLDPRRLRGTLTLVPVVNEPAFRLARRCGADGLDLARVCPGDPAGSPTRQLAHQLSQLIRAADYFIDLHTGGLRLRVLPLAGYLLHAEPGVLAAQRRMARAFNLPLVWGTEAGVEGRSLSVARDAAVPAIYAEYLGGGGYSQAAVAAYVEGCLGVMADLGMVDRPAADPLVARVVEDPRRGSGHLQAAHPAPAAGLFEAAVELGQSLRAGEPLGTIWDPLADRQQTVYSRQTGIVLALRALAVVEAGESLAYVLEADAATA